MFVTNGIAEPGADRVAFTVNCEPTEAPNPDCCSDPGAMCVNCAKAAIDDYEKTDGYGNAWMMRGFNGRGPWAVANQDGEPTANVPTDPQPLPESDYGWGKPPEPAANYHPNYLGSEPVQSGAGAEPLPSINWDEVFKPQPRSTDQHRPDTPKPLTTTVAGGVAPLPELDFGF